VVLQTNDGEQTLKPGMCAGFPAGSGDAHRFVNRSATESCSSLVTGVQVTRSPTPTWTCMQFSALKASIDTVPNPASLFERGTPLDVVPA
jgi:hypothetical protein